MSLPKSSRFFKLSHFTLLEWMLLLACTLMFAGFIGSRALLSFGTVFIAVLGLWPSRFKKGWLIFKNNKLVWLMPVFFLSYFISGLWSEDTAAWWQNIQVKIPFLLLPFAMLNLPFHKKEIQKWVIFLMSFFLLAGMFYSLSFLINHFYLFSRGDHLPSPVFEDYIRFTMAIVLTIEMALYVLRKKNKFQLPKWLKIWFWAWIVIAIIYLHVQAAKSGLLCFYLLVFIHLFYYVFQQKGRGVLKKSIFFAVVLLVLFLGINFTPAVKNQLEISKKEWAVWKSNQDNKFKAGYSLIPRLISYEVAWEVIKEHPLLGVGGGDIVNAIESKYELIHPEIPGRLMPHNQFFTTAVRIGLPLTGFLILLIFIPILKPKNRMLLVTSIIMLVGTVIEAMLEVQVGVFVYLFFMLFWLKDADSTIIQTSGSKAV